MGVYTYVFRLSVSFMEASNTTDVVSHLSFMLVGTGGMSTAQRARINVGGLGGSAATASGVASGDNNAGGHEVEAVPPSHVPALSFSRGVPPNVLLLTSAVPFSGSPVQHSIKVFSD